MTELEFPFATVTAPSSVTPAGSQLILSVFPGADLFGMGFEAEGFCVVQARDAILGGDVRNFHPPAGKFAGVIGGPPCPDFSRARRGPPTGYGVEMIQEFLRVCQEAAPAWFLMENVAGVPSITLPGYRVQRLDLDASQFGLPQRRLRHFQFGSVTCQVLPLPRGAVCDAPGCDPTCVASHSGGRSWERFKALQGLAADFDLPSFTQAGKFRAVGNGVPVPMARALARAIVHAAPSHVGNPCACGCGRPVTGRQKLALPACRKRVQRRREVTVRTIFPAAN